MNTLAEPLKGSSSHNWTLQRSRAQHVPLYNICGALKIVIRADFINERPDGHDSHDAWLQGGPLRSAPNENLLAFHLRVLHL